MDEILLGADSLKLSMIPFECMSVSVLAMLSCARFDFNKKSVLVCIILVLLSEYWLSQAFTMSHRLILDWAVMESTWLYCCTLFVEVIVVILFG